MKGAELMTERAVAPGQRTWAFAAGYLPDGSTGREPEFTSRDELCLLNTTEEEACATMTVYRDDADPMGPYEIRVPPRRVRHVRINDLMDPRPVPLGIPYGVTVRSDVPLVIQMRHLDTRQAELGVAILPGVTGAE